MTNEFLAALEELKETLVPDSVGRVGLREVAASAEELCALPVPQIAVWQPIDTAPINTYVLVVYEGTVMIAIRKGGLWNCGVQWAFQPTYWMPLPLPPKEGEE